MAIKLNVSLDFEVETAGVVKDSATATDFVEQSLVELVAYYNNLANDPTYVGPKVRVVIPQNPVKAVAE